MDSHEGEDLGQIAGVRILLRKMQTPHRLTLTRAVQPCCSCLRELIRPTHSTSESCG